MERKLFDDLDYDFTESKFTLNGKPFSDIAYEVHEEGWVLSEGVYINGYKNGLHLEYFSSGIISSESYYSFNALHGTSREWFPNGNIRKETFALFAVIIREKTWNVKGVLIQVYEIDRQSFNYELMLRSGGYLPPVTP
jgi:antitoxin component YwqK of YwqJK toxin-antitoxin module